LKDSCLQQTAQFSETQLRLENANLEVKSLRKQLKASESMVETMKIRRQKQVEDIQILREEKRAIQAELEKSQEALRASAVPEAAEIAKAHEKARNATEEASRANGRVSSLASEVEYLRSSYQEASSAAVEASTEITDLKAQIQILSRKASGETARLRQLMEAEHTRVLERENEELRLRLVEREEALMKKEEEIKTLAARGRGGVTGGGMMTRASSVPRSPRPLSRAASPLPSSSPMLSASGSLPVHLSPLGKTSQTFRAA
jgi:chromosome segregation ATPase